MVDDRIGRLAPAQCLARMALLPTGLLAGRFPQTADARRLPQPIAGRWLAAVAAVQPETALQLGNLCAQCRHVGRMPGLLRQQQCNQVVF
jgi:hypothetical protein